MNHPHLRLCVCWTLLLSSATVSHASSGPYEGSTFRGRIAYSADGNFNDPDDWAASPMALAIFAEAGVKDRLVHFDYNCILPRNDPEWERIHAESVLGAAERYGYDLSLFHDCRKDRDAALESITRAIDESSTENPLYFILAGPMEVPYLGIRESDPEKRQFVYCISHSRWNDGFSSAARHDFFTYNKRSVIELGVNWVQINGQNPLLRPNPYGREATEEEWAQYHWMRDSDDPKVRFLWERMEISGHPDPSDAGMAYFLVTGDEQADPVKLKRLLDENVAPTPIAERSQVRLEAEDFPHLDGYELEDRNDRQASHRLNVKPSKVGASGRIGTRFRQPYAAAQGRYDVDVRYLDEQGQRCRFTLAVNGDVQGEPFMSSAEGRGWTTHTVRDVAIGTGDEIAVEIDGGARVDYVQLNRRTRRQARSDRDSSDARESHPRFTARGPLDDPAALPGQIIVAGSNPGYLKYNGGGTAYLCGPDNPEDFLFLGTLNEDGTRSGGGQEQLIQAMADAGVSAFHCQMTRIRRCNIKDEGDDTHSPFIDHDPSMPLNEAVLDQWDGWISRLEAAGVVIHLEFYNDATDVELMGWTLDENGELHPDERRFFADIVNRFKHHKNIIWGIEESLNKLPRERTPHFMKLSELISRVDNYNHPIVHSFVTPQTSERDFGTDHIMSDEYIGDPHIDLVTWLHVLPHGEDYEAQHAAYLEYALIDRDRFIVMKNETERFPTEPTQSRRYMWSCTMTGMHNLESGHNLLKAHRRKLIGDDGRICRFMEQTDFYTMQPRDDLAAGSTNWVLANPGQSYIAYTYEGRRPMGLTDIPAGRYDLLWFDTIDGDQVTQEGVSLDAGEAHFDRPPSIGTEAALYVKRQR